MPTIAYCYRKERYAAWFLTHHMRVQVVMIQLVQTKACSVASVALGRFLTRRVCHTGAALRMMDASLKASGNTVLCCMASPVAKAGRAGARTSQPTSKAWDQICSTSTSLTGKSSNRAQHTWQQTRIEHAYVLRYSSLHDRFLILWCSNMVSSMSPVMYQR